MMADLKTKIYFMCASITEKYKFYLPTLKSLFFLTILIVTLDSCQKDPIVTHIDNQPLSNNAADLDAHITDRWMKLYLEMEKDIPSFRPAASARAISYISMGAYEAILPGMHGYVSNAFFQPELNIPSLPMSKYEMNWHATLNAYYADMFRYFILNRTASQSAQIDAAENEMNLEMRNTMFADVFNNSTKWGKSVADAMIDFAITDREGSLQSLSAFPSNYVIPVHPGSWIPTDPNNKLALFPQWGKVRAFAAKENDLLAIPPVPYSENPNSEYFLQHQQVNEAVTNLSPEQRWEAEFWSDDLVGLTFSPPARLIAIARQVLGKENYRMDQTIYFYCKLGIAINDAAVAAWNSKYSYNTERPETYIRKFINPNFKTILGATVSRPGLNPPFPGYPSGHATFGGIQEVVFGYFFGRSYKMSDHSHEGRTEFLSNPRSFESWNQMAEENAYSRIFLGVHVKMDCDEGLRLGNLIGRRVVNEYDLKVK